MVDFTNNGKMKVTPEIEQQVLYSILEDVNESQEKLKIKYEYIEGVKTLLEYLTSTADIRLIMIKLLNIYKKIIPFSAITFVVLDDNRESFSDFTTYTQNSVNGDYYNKIKYDFIDYVEKIDKKDISNKREVIKELKKREKHEFIQGSFNDNIKSSYTFKYLVPVMASGKLGKSLFGIFHISCQEMTKDTYPIDKMEIAFDLAKIVAYNVEKVKYLIQSEQSRIQDLVDSMSNAVLMFDNSSRIIIANPALKAIINIKKGVSTLDNLFEEIDKNVLTGKTDVKKIKDISDDILKIYKLKKTKKFVDVMINERDYEVSIIPLFDDHKEVFGGAVVLHDITHLKEMDRMKTQFISLFSHELRTPLAAVNYYLEILKDVKVLDTDMKQCINEAYDSSLSMTDLINNLLTLSRIEQGRFKLYKDDANIENIIQRSIDLVKPFNNKKVKIKFLKPEKINYNLSFDVEYIKQAINQVIKNAVIFSLNKGKEVIVELKFEKNNFFYITVRDDGVGIPEVAKAQIYDKFYRADNIKKKVINGMGIGLFIAKEIIEASDGEISFESKQDKGTVFVIKLPFCGK